MPPTTTTTRPEATRTHLRLLLNGKPVTVENADPRTTVLEFVRSRDARLTGTKLGCGEGGCGACTVLVTRYEPNGKAGGAKDGVTLRHRSINACLAPLCSVDGAHVTTVEGIGTADQPHPAQERIAKLHGSQCGFCTPGIVMALYSKLASNPAPTAQELEETFDGNLCRCTGYRPILDAAKTFAVDIEDTGAPAMCTGCPNREQCGLPLESATAEIVVSDTRSKVLAPRREERWAVAFDPTGSHAPPTLPAEYATIAQEALEVSKTLDDGSSVTWHRPATLAGLLAIKRAHPSARLIAGNTEVGIETKIAGCRYAHLVSVSPAIAELFECEHDTGSNTFSVGSGVTLTALKTATTAAPCSATDLTTTAAIGRILSWFASTAIRNGASVGGNVCTASPIGDLMPILIASGATFIAGGLDPTGVVSTRPIPAADWLAGYRKTSLQPHEILVSIRIPCTPAPSFSAKGDPQPTNGRLPRHVATAYKQSRRREDDISIVTGAFTAVVDADTCTVATCVAAFGGVAPQTVACPVISETLVAAQLPFTRDVLQRVRDAVRASLPMGPTTPGGMPAFRLATVASMVERFGLDVAAAMNGAKNNDAASYMAHHAPVTSGRQQFTRDPAGGHLKTSKPRLGDSVKKRRGAYGEPVPHQAGLLHATGEAAYVDDLEEPRGLLFAAPVLSDRPTGRFDIPSADAVEAMPGVVRVVTARDVRGSNVAGAMPPYDEELFRSSEVTAAGQLIALVLADTQEHATAAAKALDVVYAAADAPSPVVTISQSLAAGKTHPAQLKIISGDTASAFAQNGLAVVEGTVRINGQEHFYLEPSGAVATPKDGGAELEVISSCQGPAAVLGAVARATGMPMHKLTSSTKRLGGAFGGKSARMFWIAAAAAVAAQLTKRPVKFLLDRQTDMLTQGTRHPFMGKYKLGADKQTGKLVALELELFSNAGYATDFSVNVMKWALLHATNAYKVASVSATGTVCHTNTANNTAFRGFGAPQAMFIMESAMEAMALKLNLADTDLRGRNLFAASGDVGHHGQEITGNPVPRLWQAIQTPQYADVARRQADIDAFNRVNAHKKRGLALLPTVYGIGFETKFLNQGGCNVNIYTDGTVKVSHGGTEMGQGLHTKVVQLVASTLGIPHERVFVAQTSTDHVPNATPTGGSVSFDLYGGAALDACEKLNARLKPYLPDDWHDTEALGNTRCNVFNAAVSAAFFDRVDLCAHGFFINHTDYNFALPSGPDRGTPFNYYTTGVACSECEVDLLSGDMRVLRADILMDLGISPNPAIDIGQVEGAYVQGMGYYTLEETVWGSTDEHRWLKPGQCFTRGPGNFKIPSSNDVPVDLRVTLLGEAPNPNAVHSSKAVGEPPLFLGSTAAFAARNAVRAALKARNADGGAGEEEAEMLRHTDSPFSAERLRMLVGDATAKFFTTHLEAAGGSARPALFC